MTFENRIELSKASPILYLTQETTACTPINLSIQCQIIVRALGFLNQLQFLLYHKKYIAKTNYIPSTLPEQKWEWINGPKGW